MAVFETTGKVIGPNLIELDDSLPIAPGTRVCVTIIVDDRPSGEQKSRELLSGQMED